jgi:hypothetical protein
MWRQGFVESSTSAGKMAMVVIGGAKNQNAKVAI